MNLRSVDLNLLVILDALLDEAHVGHAAQRLNLSQPAVSNALQRCRALFADPLLTRGRGVMHRTKRAEQLRAPIKALLVDVVDILNPEPVPIRDLRQTIRIMAADDPTALVARDLVERLSQSAPGLNVVFLPWQGADATVKALVNGDAELSISVFSGRVEHIETTPLLSLDYVVTMRRGHAAEDGFTLQKWLDFPHVVVSGRGAVTTPVDAILSAQGLGRRVALVVPSFQLVPQILTSTDYLAMLPRQSVERQAQLELTMLPPPIDVDGFSLDLAWHVRQSNDTGVLHVIDTVVSLFRG